MAVGEFATIDGAGAVGVVDWDGRVERNEGEEEGDERAEDGEPLPGGWTSSSSRSVRGGKGGEWDQRGGHWMGRRKRRDRHEMRRNRDGMRTMVGLRKGGGHWARRSERNSRHDRGVDESALRSRLQLYQKRTADFDVQGIGSVMNDKLIRSRRQSLSDSSLDGEWTECVQW